MKIITVPLIVVGLAVFSVATYAQRSAAVPTKMEWQTDLGRATAEGKRSGKLVMVDFNATWCGPCRMYKSDVFPTAKFKEATKNVILVDIDVDKNAKLAKQFQISSIPDIRFISPQGKQVGQLSGFGGIDPLLAELAKAKQALKK